MVPPNAREIKILFINTLSSNAFSEGVESFYNVLETLPAGE
jgi:hypothetical protein